MRTKVKGIVLVPETFRTMDVSITHKATRYIVYADRAKTTILEDATFDDQRKWAYTFKHPTMYDDIILFFSTNVQLSDDTWSGESPVSRVVLKKDRAVSSGIIVTPEVTVNSVIGGKENIAIFGSAYVRYDGIGVHSSTDYVIEDELTGEIKYERLNDYENLTSIVIKDLDLSSGRVYRVKMRYRDVIGRYSNYGVVMHTTYNILDILSEESEMEIPYGVRVGLKPANNEILFMYDALDMQISVGGKVVKDLEFIDGAFTIDTLDYEVGDVLMCEVSYGSISKTLKVLIVSSDYTVDVDDNFEIVGKYRELDATGFLLGGVSTSFESESGVIFDINPATKKLVAVKYDPLSNKLTVERNLTDLASEITSDYTYRTILKNPLGGLIAVVSKEDGSNSQKVLFLEEDGTDYSLVKTLTINHKDYSITHNDTQYIRDGVLYMYNRCESGVKTKKRVLAVDLLTRTVSDTGSISYGDYDMRNYNPIEVDGQIQLYGGGLNNEGQDEISFLTSPGIVSDGNGWVGAAVSKGKIYGIPYNDNRIIVIDTNNNDSISFLTHAGITTAGGKWFGGSVSNGKIYAAPFLDSRILVIDTNNNDSISFLTNSSMNDRVSNKWAGVVTSGNKVYMIPRYETRLLIVNSLTQTITYKSVTSNTNEKWSGGVEVNGRIYAVPFYTKDILVIDTNNNDSISFLTHPDTTNGGWYRATTSNGKVYMAPFTAGKNILVVDTNNNDSISFLTHPAINPTLDRWLDATTSNGKVYMVPVNDNRVLVIDTNNNDSISFLTNAAIASGGTKWHALVAVNNVVYGVPYSVNKILVVDVNNPNQSANDVLIHSTGTTVTKHSKQLNTLPVMKDNQLIYRAGKLKNGKPYILYTPSVKNNTMGILVVDPYTLQITNKMIPYLSGSNHRIVYTLDSGKIITAMNDKAVLLS